MGHWMTDVNGDDYYVGDVINPPVQSRAELEIRKRLKHEMYCHVKENRYGWWSCDCGQLFCRIVPQYRYCPACGRIIILEI